MSIVNEVCTWASEHVTLLVEWGGIWIVSLLATVLAARYYLISIPADYFARPHQPFDARRDSHPVLRWTLMISKNVIGFVFLVAGLVMLVTPGPGWIALLLGLYLVDLPGKRTAERKILRQPAILNVVNRLRARARKTPLEFGAAPVAGAGAE